MKTLKNYTTDVPASKTISEVQSMLLGASATGIMMETESGQIKSMFFKLKVGEQELPFKLPAKPEKVYSILFAGMRGEWDSKIKQQRMDKANNIAWRIVKDWLDIQLSLIKMQIAKPAEVFMPYLLVGQNQTLFDQAESDNFGRLLPSGM